MIDILSQQFSEMVRNYALVLGGAIGLYFGWQRVSAANKQAATQIVQTDLAHRIHASDLFNRAVGQLGDKKLEIRLGAIFTLEQICQEYPNRSGAVIRLLATYLKKNNVKYGLKRPPSDVLAIMEILREFKK
jgi:hypothetical protein